MRISRIASEYYPEPNELLLRMAYVAEVPDCKLLSKCSKILMGFPMPLHLKRIQPPLILIAFTETENSNNQLQTIIKTFESKEIYLSGIRTKLVPSTSPPTSECLPKWNTHWPCQYRHVNVEEAALDLTSIKIYMNRASALSRASSKHGYVRFFEKC